MRAAHVIVASGVVVVVVVAVIAFAGLDRDPAPHESAVPARPLPDPARTAATPEPMPLAPPSAADGRQPPLAPPSDPGTIVVQRDPQSPEYDANKLLHASAGPPTELFAAEPRDEAWAPEREDVVKTITLPRLREVDPDAKIDIECRTAMCLVHVDSRNKALSEWLGVYPLGCLAKSYSVVGTDPDVVGSGSVVTRPDFYLIFDPHGRSRAGLMEANEACSKHHDDWIEQVKSGNPPWAR